MTETLVGANPPSLNGNVILATGIPNSRSRPLLRQVDPAATSPSFVCFRGPFLENFIKITVRPAEIAPGFIFPCVNVCDKFNPPTFHFPSSDPNINNLKGKNWAGMLAGVGVIGAKDFKKVARGTPEMGHFCLVIAEGERKAHVFYKVTDSGGKVLRSHPRPGD